MVRPGLSFGSAQPGQSTRWSWVGSTHPGTAESGGRTREQSRAPGMDSCITARRLPSTVVSPPHRCWGLRGRRGPIFPGGTQETGVTSRRLSLAQGHTASARQSHALQTSSLGLRLGGWGLLPTGAPPQNKTGQQEWLCQDQGQGCGVGTVEGGFPKGGCGRRQVLEGKGPTKRFLWRLLPWKPGKNKKLITTGLGQPRG